MQNKNYAAVLWTALFCFIFWTLLTCSFNARDVILGIIFSILVAVFCSRFWVHEGGVQVWNPIRLIIMAVYSCGVLLVEMIKANIDVAFRVFEKDMKVNPGIVKIPVEDLDSEYGKAMLANSITLTPGTITMDIVEEEDEKTFYYIHWIDVKSRDPKEAADIIKGSMEPWIRRIWQ